MLTLYFNYPHGSMLTLDGKIYRRRTVKLDNGSEIVAALYKKGCMPCTAGICLTRDGSIYVTPCSEGVKLLRCDASAAELFFFPQPSVVRVPPAVVVQKAFSYSGGEHLVTIFNDGRSRLNIENHDCLYTAELPERYDGLSVNGDGSVFVVTADRAAEIVAFDGDYSPLLSVRGDIVDISERGVTVTDDIYGMRKCRRTLTYSENGGAYSIASADFAYDSHEYISALSAELLAFYLDIGDIASAERYLGDGIGAKELREFFGDHLKVERVYRPYRENCIEKLYDGGGVDLILKTFRLEYSKNKVTNVIELD